MKGARCRGVSELLGTLGGRDEAQGCHRLLIICKGRSWEGARREGVSCLPRTFREKARRTGISARHLLGTLVGGDKVQEYQLACPRLMFSGSSHLTVQDSVTAFAVASCLLTAN